VSQFLDDQQLGPAIGNLMRGPELRCAVAFWGNGASRALFPNGRPPDDARIICDISMGGTNPNELRTMGAPHNSKIQHLQGLHAKVYLSNSGLITCSANASNNGIGFLAAARLVEAGAFDAPGGEAYASAARWFEKVWVCAKMVDDQVLLDAQTAWDRRRRGGIPLATGLSLNPTSLFDVVANNPTRFRGVGFVFATHNANVEQRDEATRAVVEDAEALEVPLMKEDWMDIMNWRVSDVFPAIEAEDIAAWPGRFICGQINGQSRFSYYFYKRAWITNQGSVLGKRSRTLRRELGFAHDAQTMATTDTDRALLIFDRINKTGRYLYESGESLAKLLSELP